MAVNYLSEILKILHRKPCSQAELCQKLSLSKSHIHSLVANLITPGLIEKVDQTEYNQEQGRPRQNLAITHNLHYCSVLIVHHCWEFKAYLLAYGVVEEIASKDLLQVDSVELFIKEVGKVIDEFVKLYLPERDAIKAITIATQATIEQGCSGMMYRNNLLKDENVPLAKLMFESLGIKTYVYNYAYGHMLTLLHAPSLNTDNAMVLSCGEGSVALGVFLDNKMILGRNNSFPECSHLPFKYGFEQSLGLFGAHTQDALMFAICAIAPIYNIDHVIVAGSCFDEHLDIIYKVQQELRKQADPLLHNLIIEYRGLEIEQHLNELIYLSFDAVVDVLDPKIEKRSLSDLVKSYQGF